MNIKITISYDGSKFNGSSIQPHTTTVQGSFEKALRSLGIDSKTTFSSRTDKNVHATNQVLNLFIPDFWNDLKKLHYKLNKLLGNYIQVKSIKKVDDDFHARFSAKKRVYRYILSTKPTTPFNTNYIYYHKNLNIKLLQNSIKYFIGKHDFEYFSKTGSDPNTTIREIFDAKVYQYKEFIIIKFCANAYLRSQIRMMVDFLLKISDKKLSIDDLKDQLTKKRRVSNKLAPPNGLYLNKVYY